MTYEPLPHKYRPQTFADLVGQEAIATTLTNAITTQRIAPAYLFTGPRGTGKTSSARILAKSLNCIDSQHPTPSPCGKCQVCRGITNGSALDVIEIDAASNTGVDNIREIIERAQFAPVQCRYKVYVIDECHMLSTAAFNALLKTLEEPPDRVIFVLATTDPQRVLPTIISRCQRFDYRRIPLESMTSHLQYIAQQENIDITTEAITIVAQIANGGLRDAESLLDQLSLLSATITVERVWDLVGAVAEQDLLGLLQAIREDNAETVLSQCRHLMNKGREPLVVLQNLAGFYLNLLIAKTAPSRQDLVAVTTSTWQHLSQEAQQWNLGTILAGQQHLKDSEVQIKNTTQPRLWLEITLLGLLPSALITPEPAVSKQTQPQPTQTQIKPNTTIATPPPQTSIPHQPTPTPIQETPPPVQPVTTNIPASESLADHQIWQNLLDHVQPPTTQAFLEQQCHLISFADSVAYIGVNGQGLMKMAKSKLANIEAAFQKIYQHKVTVHFQLGTTQESKKKSTQVEIIREEISTPPAIIPATTSEIKPTAIKPNSQVNKLKPTNTLVKQAQTPSNSGVEDQEIVIHSGDFKKASESIAKFFNGEIINLTNKYEKTLGLKSESLLIEEFEFPESIEDEDMR